MNFKNPFSRNKQNAPDPYDLRNHPNAIKLAADAMGGDKAKKLIVELKQVSQQLTQKDIQKWRLANQYALNFENPKRYDLYNIYDDAMHDLHLKGAIRNRKLRVMSSAFKIVDQEGNENKDLTRLLRTSWFRKFLSLSLDAKFYGHSLIQFDDIIREGKLRFKSVSLVPRRHVCPEYNVLLKEVSDEPKKGWDYLKPPYSVWSIPVGDPFDLGELDSVAKEAISKKYVLQFWDQFGELFGIPMRIAESASRDKKDLDRIETALEDMGSAFYGLFPAGTTIKVVETAKGDAYQVFDKRIERSNTEMSKAILGATMTIDDGSSRSQSEVHERVTDEVADDDEIFIVDVVNDQLIPFLNMHGFNFGDNMEFAWDDTYVFTPKEMKEIEEMIMGDFDVDPQYLTDKYGVPIIGKKNNQPINDPEKDPEKKKLISKLPIIHLVNDFYQLHSCPHCGTHSPFEGANEDIITFAASDLQKEAERLAKLIFDGKLKAGDVDPDMIKLVAEKLREAMIKGFGKDFPKIDYNTPDWKMLENLETNVYHFSAAKNYQELKSLTTLLKDGDKLRTFNEFRKEVQKLHTIYNESWLKTEFSTARNSSATAARWTEYEQNKKSMPFLKYQTAGDERVRQSHQALDNVTRKIDDSFWKSYYPPNGWNCRCTVIQLPDMNVKETNMDKIAIPEVESMFKTNLAKSGLAFPPDHPYYDIPSKDSKKVFEAADKIKPDRSKKPESK